MGQSTKDTILIMCMFMLSHFAIYTSDFKFRYIISGVVFVVAMFIIIKDLYKKEKNYSH